MARVFSALQPSGNVHIGNYLGAISRWVKLQDEYPCLFSIVDLHAITVPQDPKTLRTILFETAALYLACGLDPKRSTLFVQSDVSEHTELAWILGTVAKVAELKLMHQFKEKSKDAAEVSAGLFTYPILMAADILLYKSTHVPVGEDQKQHVELTRELARRFNSRFGETFPLPEALLSRAGARIMALDNPLKKMSKSAQSEGSFIALTDIPDAIRKKIRRAVTDSGTEIVFRKDKPALANLMTVYHLFSGVSFDHIEQEYKGKGYQAFKDGLAEVIITALQPIQKKLKHFSKEKNLVKEILGNGAASAQTIARATMEEVRKKVGLR